MKTNQHSWFQKALVTVSIAVVTLPFAIQSAQAKTTDELAPHAAAYGYFVDHYRQNIAGHTTVQNNPVVGEMSSFSTYWSSGQAHDPDILNQNIVQSAIITQHRTDAEATRSYLTDCRDLRYNLISGLGPYATTFIKNANAQTDFTTMPTTPLPANTPYSKVEWADPTSTLGPLVKLVNTTVHSPFSGTGVVKHVVKYIRPYRQSPQVKVLPALSNVMAAAKSDDYDFPSGHTTAAFETGLTLAYAVPERFQELITRASEVGYDRVLAGRHSPLAVIGGRLVGTAMTAAVLNDPENQDLKQQAYQVAHTNALLDSKAATAVDDFSNYQTNRTAYRSRLTYGFKPSGDTHQAMRVPKGAEVLLASRLPYLSTNQRRDVLYTTGLPSGYPVLDDTEGWGRLDLFSATNGYGALNQQVTITMDAKRGGFNAQDTWRNNLTGQGQLVKKGTGTLTLAGNNQFTGGVRLKAGTLNLASPTAAGKGTIILNGGTLQVTKNYTHLGGQFRQSAGRLVVTPSSHLKIKHTAKLGGTLALTKGHLKNGTKLMTFQAHTGKFKRVTGLPHGWHVHYTKHAVSLAK